MEFVGNKGSVPNIGNALSRYYVVALRRVQSALESYNEETIMNVVHDEIARAPPVASTLFTLLRNQPGVYARDRYSTSLVHRYLGFEASPFTAALSTADGSCLFNSASLRITGR